MALRFFSYLLVGVLMVQLLLVPAPCRAASPQEQKQTFREKLFEIDPGSIILVKTRGKEDIRGRFQTMTDEGLTMQVAKGDKVSDRTVAFTDVKSLKKEGTHTAAKTVGWVVLGGLAALGAIFLTALIAMAASGGWD